MNKCRSFATKEVYDATLGGTKEVGYCLSTKECDLCDCGGDPSKCDFYESKRKEEKKMTAAEMWLKAQKDGNTYINDELLYNKELGFVWNDDFDEAETLSESWTRTDVLSEEGWQLYTNVMTRSEAEKKFNIKIIG